MAKKSASAPAQVWMERITLTNLITTTLATTLQWHRYTLEIRMDFVDPIPSLCENSTLSISSGSFGVSALDPQLNRQDFGLGFATPPSRLRPLICSKSPKVSAPGS